MARLITLFALFALWEIGGGRLFDTFYFSKPSLIAKAFAVEVADPLFYRDLATTGLELILGYVLGAVAAITLGILLARWRFVGRICDPFLLLNSVPRVAVGKRMADLQQSDDAACLSLDSDRAKDESSVRFGRGDHWCWWHTWKLSTPS